MNLDVLPDLVTPITSWAKRDPDAVAVTEDDRRTTRDELHRRSDAAAAALQGHGVAAGDRVVIMGSMSTEWCVGALGVLKAGATIVPMTERFSASEASAVLDRVHP